MARAPLALGHDSPVTRADRVHSDEVDPFGRRVHGLVLCWLAALTGLLLGPALGRGFALSYDMVFVPDQDLGAAALGATDAPPRAVPVDALVALADDRVPGVVLHKVLLVAILLLMGWGAARLAAPGGTAAQLVAGTVYSWNPYVGERLALGHWSLLAAYAALPWLVAAAIDLRHRSTVRSAAVLVLGLAAAGLTPTGSVLAALVVGAVLAWPGATHRARLLAGAGAAWLLLALPWLTAALLSGPWVAAPGAAEASGRAFASRSENVLGVPGTLLGLGGVWNADVVPPSRELGGGWLGLLWTALLLALAALGARTVRRALGPGGAGGLAAAAALGLVVALAGATPGLRDGLVRLVDVVPALGLLRDGQRWLAPWALLLALAAGLGAARLSARVRERDLARLVVAAAVVLLLALVPDLVYGVGGKVRAARYPDDWQQVDRVLSRDHRPGSVLVLPWSTFRAFRFTDGRTVLDPAPRYLHRDTVTDDDLTVGGRTVPGESRLALDARRALDLPDPAARSTALRGLGVGWVLVEEDQPGPVTELDATTSAYDGTDLRLLHLDGDIRAREHRHVTVLAAAHLVAAALVLLAAGAMGAGWVKRVRRRRAAATLLSPADRRTDPG